MIIPDYALTTFHNTVYLTKEHHVRFRGYATKYDRRPKFARESRECVIRILLTVGSDTLLRDGYLTLHFKIIQHKRERLSLSRVYV